MKGKNIFKKVFCRIVCGYINGIFCSGILYGRERQKPHKVKADCTFGMMNLLQKGEIF